MQEKDKIIQYTGPDATDASTTSSSPLAQAVSRLKQASFKTARERERVPQPLFWSLFRSEIDSIKEKKQTKRILSEIFGSTTE